MQKDQKNQDEVLLYYVKKFLRESAEATITKEQNSRSSKKIAKARRVIQILNKI